MFKHLLIPVDGSDFSDRAIDAGVSFAKAVGARVTGFIAEPQVVVPNLPGFVGRESGAAVGMPPPARQHGQSALDRITARAGAAGVPCEVLQVADDNVAEAIVAAALRQGCDLIVMASHDRTCLDRLLHGSATDAVLGHTAIPVLVLR